MGEASVSQLQIWDHALPSLVTKVGWYACLPAETVAFVRPDHEIIDIHAHLRAFLSEPWRYAQMGELAAGLCRQPLTWSIRASHYRCGKGCGSFSTRCDGA